MNRPAELSRELGVVCLDDGRCSVRVWAPRAQSVALEPTASGRRLELAAGERGYWHLVTDALADGDRYRLILDGTTQRPDPASRWQPEGVHGPSAVVDHGRFRWSDAGWTGIEQRDLVIYELHAGTFTPEGTFAAIIPRLPDLRELGITAIELMPVAQFPGERNWGYDGVCPFAVQDSYGGPEGLKTLVDACHRQGLAVILDVVYNHLGPEGNYLRDFGPYFTDRYRTPWGEAMNFDDADSDEVRHYFIANALAWLEDYHVDGLRLDALHAVFDQSAYPFLRELGDRVRGFAAGTGRRCWLIGESDLNDVRLIQPARQGGLGLDGQWNDDFHHALHALLTGERQVYYRDFGAVADLGRAFAEGFVYDGRYSAYRRRRHGSSAAGRPGHQLVVFAQNHDQVGNRPAGERLIARTGPAAARVAAAAVIFSANLPLLFMGEEYGEQAPFPYFVSFGDAELAAAVREGRREEFAGWDWGADTPDPQSAATFARARLDWERRHRGDGARLLDFHRQLLALRRAHPALGCGEFAGVLTEIREEQELLLVGREGGGRRLRAVFACGRNPATLKWSAAGRWEKILDSTARRWGGTGDGLPAQVTGDDRLTAPPLSFTLYERIT